MPSEQRKLERRKVLKTGCISLIGLFSAVGTAAATPRQGKNDGNGPPEHAGRPEHAGPPEWAKIQNDQLQVSASRSEWRKATEAAVETEGIPDEARTASYGEIKEAVSAINEMIVAGNAELSRDGSEVHFTQVSQHGGDH